MPASILVVEDEGEIRELMALHLEREGHRVTQAESGDEALDKIQAERFDLVVLDWMLPERSGLEIVRFMRAHPELRSSPVLMVTAKVSTRDIVEGLEAGADDYVTKPFDPQVLMARIGALIRRRLRLDQAPEDVFSLGELVIDVSSHQVHCRGDLVALTPSEFKLLLALASHRGRVLTRDSLIEHVQGGGVSVVGRTVDTHVFGLRKKLGACADVIETVRGVGYRVR